MKLVDLHQQYIKLKPAIQRNIDKVLNHGQFIHGPEITELEARLAEYCQAKHCVAVSSGTDALIIALMALDIGPGDEIITTAFSFFATVEAVLLLGAKPILVDIDANDYNIAAKAIEQNITKNTKAILTVDLFGQPADYETIQKIANKHSVPLIADCAQSLGATYQGKPVGSFGLISCTSFFPAKPLGCYGDGGACFTNDDKINDILRTLRDHGQDRRYHHIRLGLNARMDSLQAAVLLAKLTVFNEELKRRREIAAQYNYELEKHCKTPIIDQKNYSSFAVYSISVDKRDLLADNLAANNIPTAIHYPVPLYRQPAFSALWKQHSLPVTEETANKILSLPCHPYLTEQEVTQVAKQIIKELE